MKTFLPALICLVFFFSCKKNNDTGNNAVNPPVNSTDTLSSGWTKVAVNGFADIYFTNALTGFGVANDSILKTIDGGHTWSVAYVSNSQFYNASGTPDGKVFFTGHGNMILRTPDGGASFDSTHFGTDHTSDSYFADNNNGYLIAKDSLYHTSDRGTSWSRIQPYTGGPVDGGYHSLFFTNNSTGWLIGNQNVYRPNGSINSWTGAIFSESPAILTGIAATNSDIVYVVTGSSQFFKSTDGGANFSLLKNFGTNDWSDVHFVDSNTGYVCSHNKVFKTTDGGVNWQTVVSLATGTNIEVYFLDANHGWVCGGGYILIYNL